MLDELQSLIALLRPRVSDTLIFVGDLVDKGPQQASVVKFVRELREQDACEIVLVEGNHEDKHRRYRRNLLDRPEVARTQALAAPELPILTRELSDADVPFLEAAVPFHRVEKHNLLVVHGGIPGDMRAFPDSVETATALSGKARKSFYQILRTRYLDKATGRALVLGAEAVDDPFWADRYDGRFGHVVFGHQPFLDGPSSFPHATGVDTGAVHGGGLTALIYSSDGARSFETVPSRRIVPPRVDG